MDVEQEQLLKELQEKILTEEGIKANSIADGIIERSYFNTIKQQEQEELGFERIGELSVALSLDENNVPILTIASKSDYLIEQVQDALRKPHVERPAILEIPDEDRDRIVRIESVDVLSYLQKLEKARKEKIELMREYESEQLISEH